MKKILFLLCLPLLFLVSACSKTENVVTPNQTILVDIKPSEWKTSDGNKTYSAIVDMPEIDSNFNQYGGILVYVSFGGQTYEQIPQVFDGITYRYSTSPGTLFIDLQSALGDEVITPPGQSIRVKIILIDSF